MSGNNPCSGIDAKSREGNIRVDVLHELDNELDNLVLVHGLQVRIGDQEADIITLCTWMHVTVNAKK